MGVKKFLQDQEPYLEARQKCLKELKEFFVKKHQLESDHDRFFVYQQENMTNLKAKMEKRQKRMQGQITFYQQQLYVEYRIKMMTELKQFLKMRSAIIRELTENIRETQQLYVENQMNMIKILTQKALKQEQVEKIEETLLNENKLPDVIKEHAAEMNYRLPDLVTGCTNEMTISAKSLHKFSIFFEESF